MGDGRDEIGTNRGDGGACPGGPGRGDEAEREKCDPRADDHEAPRAPRAASTNVGSPAALAATVHDRCARSAGGSIARIVGSKNMTGNTRVATGSREAGSSVPATRRPRSSIDRKRRRPRVPANLSDLLQDVVEIVVAGPRRD